MTLEQSKIEALAVSAINPRDFDPLLRKFADDFYERLLGSVENYMVDNTQFNIGSTIHMLESTVKRARVRETVLEDALRKCASQFHYYEAQHRAKGTPEAEAKAKVNGEFVAMIHAALAPVPA